MIRASAMGVAMAVFARAGRLVGDGTRKEDGMVDDGRAAAEAVIEAIDEPRRSQMRHLHEVILDTLPGIGPGARDRSDR